MYDIHLCVWDDGEGTESSTDPDGQDVPDTDCHGVSRPGGVHDHVVAVQGDQTNTEQRIVQKLTVGGK